MNGDDVDLTKPRARPTFGEETHQPYPDPYPPLPPYGGYHPNALLPVAPMVPVPPMKEPNANLALWLGIIGLVGPVVTGGLAVFAAPVAWYVGSKSLREIDASQGQLGGRSDARTGRLLGIIGTVFLSAGVLFSIVMLLFFVGRLSFFASQM